MGYIVYLNLAHLIVGFILSLLSIYCCVNVLFRKSVLKNSVKLSPTITVYFGFVFLCSIVVTCNCGYQAIFWRPEGSNFNAYLLYFGGVISALFYNTSSISETFLCVERCISLLFPLGYSQNLKICFATFTFFGIIAANAATAIFYNYFKLIPTTSETTCQNFVCIANSALTQSVYAIKAGLCIINILFALLLAFLIKRTISNSNNAAHMNKTVFILIISTTFVEIIPYGSAYIFLTITGEQLFQYIGAYSSTTVCFNTALSVALYFKAFKKFTNNNSSIKVVTIVATTNEKQ